MLLFSFVLTIPGPVFSWVISLDLLSDLMLGFWGFSTFFNELGEALVNTGVSIVSGLVSSVLEASGDVGSFDGVVFFIDTLARLCGGAARVCAAVDAEGGTATRV